MAAVTALTLTATTASAAAPQVYASDAGGTEYTALQAEGSSMALEVPLTALGGAVPADLGLAVIGLPAGTTITLDNHARRVGAAARHSEPLRNVGGHEQRGYYDPHVGRGRADERVASRVWCRPQQLNLSAQVVSPPPFWGEFFIG